jgi:S-adenosylmethionine uptake transporter
MDGVIKHLGGAHTAVTIAAGRFGFGSLFAIAFWLRAGAPRLTREMIPAHLIRGLLIVVAATLFFFSLTRLALVEAATLGFVAPLFVPPVAALILKEPIRPGAYAAAGLGFLGVIVAVWRPDTQHHQTDWLGVGAALTAALAYAFSLTLLRLRSGQDGAVRTTLFGNLVPAAVLVPLALAFNPLPAVGALPLFALVGFCGASLWTLMAWAYARAEAQTLAPLEYSALLWSALLGWAAFAEPVRLQTLVGGLIIIAACLWAARQAGPAKG